MILASKTWPPETREDTYNWRPERVHFQRKDGLVKQVNLQKRQASETEDNDEIMFPTIPNANPAKREDFSAVGKGLECTGDVCEDAKDYPSDHIKKIISKLSYYNNLFVDSPEGTYVDTNTRGGAEDNSEPLCATTTLTKFPKTLKNENKTEKYIVNDGMYKQGIVFEMCVAAAKPCPYATFPIGYAHECTQKYSTVRLMALEGKDGDPAFDRFVIPSCCVCNIKKPKK